MELDLEDADYSRVVTLIPFRDGTFAVVMGQFAQFQMAPTTLELALDNIRVCATPVEGNA